MTSAVLETLWRDSRRAPVLAALAGEPGVWVVGGAVRDLLLGRAPARARPRGRGRRARGRAARGGAAGRRGARPRPLRHRHRARRGAPAFDLAGARRETYPRPGALPDVELGATLDDDLARRDFTVNTLALRLADGALTGVPGAQDDLDAARAARPARRAPSATTPRGCCGSRATRRGWGSRVEPRTAELAARRWPAARSTTVSGERLGAELRLLAREPQPAALLRAGALRRSARAAPGLRGRPGADRARRLALRRPTTRAPTSSRSARRCAPDAAGARARWRSPPPTRRRCRRARGSTRSAPSSPPPAPVARSTRSSTRLPLEAAVLAAAAARSPRATGSSAAATCARRSPATTCSPRA